MRTRWSTPRIPEGATPQDAVAEADAHFAGAGDAVLKWVMNPSLPPARTQPLAEHVASQGFRARGYDIYYLAGQPAGRDHRSRRA